MSNMKDDLGDRMKGYERIETGRVFTGEKPIYARIDGRGFSRFTRGMKRPFDTRLSQAMIETTRKLVSETHAVVGYTQSDEISLMWMLDGDNEREQIIFGGKLQKMTSVLAGLATAAFTSMLVKHEDKEFAAYADRLPHFDARVFELPDIGEAANAFLWRELDARRNAISMVAQHMFSHKSLQGVDRSGMLAMIAAAGVDFETYPEFFKRGTYLRRVVRELRLTDEELSKIDEAHRPAADAVFTRSIIEPLALPNLLDVPNRVEVLFGRA